MRRSLKAAVTTVLTSCIIFSDASRFAAQDATLEYRVKAEFLYNFAKFVEWPRRAFPGPDTPFTICLAGDPFRGVLERTIRGETLNGRLLTVRRIAAAEEVRGCHLVYVNESEERRSAEIIKAVGNEPMLTVGDTAAFMNNGGMIRFTERGRRIRFEINVAAAERASLRVSSRLLKLADIVRPGRRGATP
jgi:hypothetical protein